MEAKHASNERIPVSQQLAVEHLEEELDTLLALSITLADRLEPAGRGDADLTAWRLAQVLRDRLSDQKFTKSMRHWILGESSTKAAL